MCPSEYLKLILVLSLLEGEDKEEKAYLSINLSIWTIHTNHVESIADTSMIPEYKLNHE
jgi:hypothetical protein